MRRKSILGVATLVALALSTPALSAEEFIGSIWYPQSHPLDKYGYEEWAKKVIKESNGELKPNIYYGTALLPAKAHLSGLQDGIAQLTHHAGTYTPKDLPEDNVISMIAMGHSDTMATAFAMTEFGLTDPLMQARYKALRITFLGAFATPPYILMCTKPIVKLSDLKGVKVRTPGAVQADWARSVGAVPVTVPSTEMFTGLEKGQLDCAANAGNDLKTRSLWDVAKHTTLASLGLYFHGWQYAFNRDYWSKMKPQHRRIIMNTISESIPETMIGYLGTTDEALKEAPSHGVTIHQPDKGLAESIATFASTKAPELAVKAGKQRFHVKDPAGLLSRFKATYEKWQGLLKDVDRKDAKTLSSMLKKEVFDKLDEKTYGVN